MSNLAMDPRTKPTMRMEAKRALDKVRVAIARELPGWFEIVKEYIADDEQPVRERIKVIQDMFSRGGLPRRTDVDVTALETFSATDMRDIWERVCREAAANPSRGMVKPINVEFEDVSQGGTGESGPSENGVAKAG
jgi:hypothetical protein